MGRSSTWPLPITFCSGVALTPPLALQLAALKAGKDVSNLVVPPPFAVSRPESGPPLSTLFLCHVSVVSDSLFFSSLPRQTLAEKEAEMRQVISQAW